MNEENDFKDAILMSDNGIPPKTLARLHEFYIVGNIQEPEHYITMFDRIRHAQPDDVIKLYINSGGGNLLTALQFMRVISETEATVVASVEGMAASAATLLLLCADSYEISPHSLFLFHNYSENAYGKGHELYSHVVHSRKWSQALLKECYEGFLNEAEIESMLEDKDIWLTSEQVVERLKARAAHAATLNQEAVTGNVQDTE